MKIMDLIGVWEAIIIYLIVVSLLFISMLFAKPTDKPKKGSMGSLLLFALTTALLVAYILIRLSIL